MSQEKEKHLPYYTVMEAIQQAKGCPLCFLEVSTTRRYLEGVLYEFVNDSGVRRDLVRSKGYCHRHAHVLAGFRSGLGTAVLYQDQIRLLLELLETLPAPASKITRRSAVTAWAKRAPCPACRRESEGRERHVAIFVEGLDDETMRAAFDACPGLCVPHFLFVYERTKSAALRQGLVETQQRKFRTLQAELSEFIARHDYRRVGEGFGDVGDSWLRAVRLMVGEQGTEVAQGGDRVS